MAGADIDRLTASKNLKLVAVAEVDRRPTSANSRSSSPICKVYQDCRVLLDKEKDLNSVNVSTPDHMHAPIAMRAMNRGLHVYGQKPLTQTIYEARRLTEVAAEKKLVTQMGIQIHSARKHKLVVKLIQDGAIGKVKEVHSWSGKSWGDTAAKPDRKDPVPAGFDWDLWLGVAAERPFIGGGTTTPATGASGSTSAPARSATWAATSSTRSSARSASATRSRSAPNCPARTTTTGRSTCR